MTRFSLIVCVSLIVGITAKPYKPWKKIPDEAVQDSVMSMDDKRKMFNTVEVEPPQNIADAPYDVDPSMKIWKSMARLTKGELHHPSVAVLFKGQAQSLDSLPVADIQAEPLNQEMRLHLEPEEDRDHIDHPVFMNVGPEHTDQDWDEVYQKMSHQQDPLKAEYNTEAEPRVSYSEPEKDQDDLYHRDDQLYRQPAAPVQMEPSKLEARLHLHPEEDMDALYHRDVPELIPDQDAAFFPPSQKKYSEPEEDLDGIYHQ